MKISLKIMFICGVLSSLIYIATDILTGIFSPDYSFNSQTVSELSAIGAVTRPIWIAMTFVYNPLLIVFGIGMLKIADKKWSFRLTGRLIILWGILGFMWLLFPMNLRGSLGSATDTMHLVLTGITVILMTALVVVGSGTQGKWFRLYSILTILTMMTFGILTGQQTSRVAAQLPTPWMGITERICSYAPLIWVSVLSFAILKNAKALTKRA